MYSISDAQEYLNSTAEIFAKPDWANSPRSITHKLRNLVENHENNSPPELIEEINRVIIRVQKFELRIYHRCRVKKPAAPIHPDPFWIYNGYEDALDSFVWYMGSQSWRTPRYREKYPEMLSPYRLHFELLLTLELWKSFCQTIKNAPAIEASMAQAREFAADIKAAREEVATWEHPPFPT
ncbi:hypothetical protein OPQ81_008347 [Rhizoctonia solani]|nr:hypothetical protein OPQ81_008347 [Rhizoctonia solani]